MVYPFVRYFYIFRNYSSLEWKEGKIIFMNRLVLAVLSLVFLTGITGFQSKAQNSSKKDSLVYLQPKEEYQIEMQYILSILNRYHYRKAPLNDSTSSRIFDNYVTALDPSRLYFLD